MTFVNKFDRESREPFDLIGEVEQTLALDATPASWPIGMGREFLGCYDLFHDRLVLLSRSKGGMPDAGEVCEGLDDPKLDRAQIGRESCREECVRTFRYRWWPYHSDKIEKGKGMKYLIMNT